MTSLLSQKTAEELKEMNPRDIESTLHIETLKLSSKGSGDSVLVLIHVTYYVYRAFMPIKYNTLHFMSFICT